MQSIDLLVYARWIITCEDNNQVLENHALAVNQGKIIAILPANQADTSYQAKDVRRFNKHAVMPGLINSHTHLAMNLFKGLADDLDLMDWLTKYIWPSEGKLVSPEFVYDGSQLAIGEMIRCGTTCFNDMYFYPEATAKAAEQAGVRGHVGMTIIDIPTPWAASTDECFAKSREFYQQYQSSDLVTPTMAPHSTYTLSRNSLIRVNEMAKELGIKINIHLLEAAAERPQSMEKHGVHPLQLLNEIGMLSPSLIAVHMTQINESDIALVQQYKPNIVHCPESNMKLASGACPVERLLKAGVNVSLATDGAASNNDLDMISEMRSAAFLGKMTAGDPKAVPAETVLKMASINGARTLGIDHLTGSLTVGKAADFIAIDLEQIETEPLYHPCSQIVYAASRHQVTDVWVNGKELLKNRQLMTLDEQALLEKAQSWRKKLKN